MQHVKKPVLSVKSDSFIDEMKQLLEEVQDTIRTTHTYSSERTLENSAEYYDLLDNSVRDPDVMDLLSRRRQLLERIKAGGKEVQSDVRKQLEKEKCAHKLSLEEISERNLKGGTTSTQRQNLSTKPKGFLQLNKTYVKAVPNAVPKGSSISQYLNNKGIKGNQASTPLAIRIPGPRHTLQQGGTDNYNEQTSPSNVAQRISHLLKVNEKMGSSFCAKHQVSSQNSTTKMGSFVNNSDKYFPCAVPLAPPNRNKVCEISLIVPEETYPPVLISQSIASAKEFEPVVNEQLPTKRETEKLVELKLPIRKEILHNNKVISINYDEQSQSSFKKNSSHPPNSVPKKKLSMVLVHNINIEGSSTQTCCTQLKHAANNVNSVERISASQNSELSDCAKLNSSSPAANTSNRWTTPQLSSAIDALTSLRENIRAQRTSELDRKQIENIVCELVQQQMHNLQTKEERRNENTSNKVEMVNFGVQVCESVNDNKQLTSIATQTNRFDFTKDKGTQFTFNLPMHSAHTQTSIDEDVSSVSPNFNQAIQHSCCNVANNVPIHQYCNLSCHAIPCHCHSNICNISHHSCNLKEARSSTPLDYESGVVIANASQSTEEQDLRAEHYSKISQTRHVPANFKDIGTSTTSDQTSVSVFQIPELKEAAVQCNTEKPETVCSSTMTKEMENKNISIQSSDAEIISRLEDAGPSPYMRDIAIQSEVQDLSLSSTTSTVATDDFMDDFLSEGEIPLPWNLRLLSLIERGVLLRSNFQQTESTTTDEKVSDEYSLSEGEIPPRILAALQKNSSTFNLNPSGSSSSLLLSTDSSSELTGPKLVCDQFTDSQVSSSKSDLSEGQIDHPFHPQFKSSLLLGGEDPSSSNPIAAESKQYIESSEILCQELPRNRDTIRNEKDLSSEINMAHETISSMLLCPETANPSKDSSNLRSPNRAEESYQLLKFSGLEKYLSDVKPLLPTVSRSPELKTVTEEDILETQNNTDDELPQLPPETLKESTEENSCSSSHDVTKEKET